jgi:hypothetical protein
MVRARFRAPPGRSRQARLRARRALSGRRAGAAPSVKESQRGRASRPLGSCSRVSGYRDTLTASAKSTGPRGVRPARARSPSSESLVEKPSPKELLIRGGVGGIARTSQTAPRAPGELHPSPERWVALLVPVDGFVSVDAESLGCPPRRGVKADRHHERNLRSRDTQAAFPLCADTSSPQRAASCSSLRSTTLRGQWPKMKRYSRSRRFTRRYGVTRSTPDATQGPRHGWCLSPATCTGRL